MQSHRNAVAGVSALVRRGDNVLLVKRAGMPGRGKWALPGGAVKWGEPIREAVHREVLEETGVEIEVADVLDVVDVIVREGDEVLYDYVVVCFLGKYLDGEPKAGTDAEDARWIPIDNLKDYDITSSAKNVLSRFLGVKL